MNLLIHFLISTVQLRFRNGFVAILYWACDYLSMLGFKLIHVSKKRFITPANNNETSFIIPQKCCGGMSIDIPISSSIHEVRSTCVALYAIIYIYAYIYIYIYAIIQPVGWMICFLMMTFVSIQKLCVNKYIYIYIYALLCEFCFLWFIHCVLLSDDTSLIQRCL